jgi:AraC family transcriptional regulator
MAVDYEAMVRDTMAEIARRLDDPPSFRELAGRVFLSPYHFHRIFRAMTGASPAELIRRLRLERAAWQVRTTGRPITELAFAAGYGTHEAFTKAFPQAFGLPPSKFGNGPRTCPRYPRSQWPAFPSGRTHALSSCRPGRRPHEAEHCRGAGETTCRRTPQKAPTT